MTTRVSIIGSCVTRDIFNYASPGEFELVNYIARSSISSIFAEAPFKDIYSSRLESNFQKRIVNMDVSKLGKRRLESIKTDLVLIDLIDERFNLAATSSTAFCTISNEFIKTGAFKELKELNKISVIRSGSDTFVDKWIDGWRSLVTMLRAQDLLHKTYVNRVYWQPHMQSGKPFPDMSSDQILAANSLLDKLYQIMAKDLPLQSFLAYEGNVTQCPDEHPWGPAPFHFVNDFYTFALDKMRSLPA